MAVTSFITVWWGAWLVIQFTSLDRSDAPGGPGVRLAEAALVSRFVSLALVSGCATAFHLGGFSP